jgi:hypothetical protein
VSLHGHLLDRKFVDFLSDIKSTGGRRREPSPYHRQPFRRSIADPSSILGISTKEITMDIEHRLDKIEEEILTLKAQIASLEYMMSKRSRDGELKETFAEIKDGFRQKMFVLTKEISEALDPKNDSD